MRAAAQSLAQKRVGALIVLERETHLSDLIEAGTTIDAVVKRDLLVSLFLPQSPLHDGAVVIQGGRIAQAGCILPLTLREDLPEGVGTRHRAAVGITEESDAVVIVVSEETQALSVVVAGVMARTLDGAGLREVLRDVLAGGESERRVMSSLAGPRARGGDRIDGSSAEATQPGGPSHEDVRQHRIQEPRGRHHALSLGGRARIVERGARLRHPGRAAWHARGSRRRGPGRRRRERAAARHAVGAAELRPRAARVPARDLRGEAGSGGLRGRSLPIRSSARRARGFALALAHRTLARAPLGKTVKVKPDLEGQPAEGFRVAEITADPRGSGSRGARSEVLRLSEVATETIDVTGATGPVEREVRVSAGPGHVWADTPANREGEGGHRGRAHAARADAASRPDLKTAEREGMGRELFGTDGVRGRANVDPMTAEMALALGQAVSVVFKRRGSGRHKIIIGKDTRRSGYMFENALVAGICSMGVGGDAVSGRSRRRASPS